VSILNRVIPHRHLDDAALAEIWTAAALRQAQGRPEPNRATAASDETASDVHLPDCAECRTRYANFCGWLETVRMEAIEEADAAFPAERLTAQQAHILRRLEAAERPARVIAFPKFAQPLSSRSSLASRWITVAAAAGLLIGVALGQWLDLTHRFEARPQRTADATVAAAPAQPKQADMVIQTTSAISDDALLQELDASLAMHPSVAPLRALDTITPRSRDFVDQSR
jgi:hypothetical protein